MQEPSKTSLASHFEDLQSRREGALITYLTGGDPDAKGSLRNLTALAEGGADVIEIGIPFSDPIADGPVIQGSSQRSLKSGTTPKTVFDEARQLTEAYPSVPIVLLTYYNPVLAIGISRFFELASASGVSGVVVPDLPVEESSDFRTAARKGKVDTVFLAAPNTSASRLKRIVEETRGFVYLVSLFGVTGPRESLSETALSTLKRLKAISHEVPVAAGFGISRPEHVSALIRSGADGAIVGSSLVRIVGDNLKDCFATPELLESRVSELKEATRSRLDLKGDESLL